MNLCVFTCSVSSWPDGKFWIGPTWSNLGNRQTSRSWHKKEGLLVSAEKDCRLQCFPSNTHTHTHTHTLLFSLWYQYLDPVTRVPLSALISVLIKNPVNYFLRCLSIQFHNSCLLRKPRFWPSLCLARVSPTVWFWLLMKKVHRNPSSLPSPIKKTTTKTLSLMFHCPQLQHWALDCC